LRFHIIFPLSKKPSLILTKILGVTHGTLNDIVLVLTIKYTNL